MTRNRKNKLIILGILAIVYITIAINFHKIRFALSIMRIYGKDNKSETLIISDGDNNDNIGNGSDNTSIVDNPLEDILVSVDNVDKTPEDITKQNKTSQEDTKKTYISIISEYNTVLEDLRSSFESDLDDLIKQGLEDYSKKEISNAKLASKYLSIGANLEKSSDAKFNKILKNMEKELKSNDYDVAIIEEIKNYYTSFKDAKKTTLIDRGMKHID